MGFFDTANFDASKVEPSSPFTAIPAGDYLCLITKGEEKKTKAGTGDMLVFTLKILQDGPAKNRQLTWRLNVRNPNAQAMEIGQKDLSALCHAVSIKTPKHISEFTNKTITVKVSVCPRNDKPDLMTNEVDGVVLSPEKLAQVGTSAGNAQPAAPATPASAPWAAAK